MKARSCPECGELMGSNGHCETCLEYNLNEGSQSFDEDDIPAALVSYERWQKKRGRKAPDYILQAVKLLAKFLKHYLQGAVEKLPPRCLATVIFVLIYVINPWDLIPDFIPGVGWIDDSLMLALLWQYCGELLQGLEPALKVFKKLNDKLRRPAK